MAGIAEGFEQFWTKFPRKVAKLAALREYQKARRLDSAENILAGLERYLTHLPDEVRYIPHARTWLFQGRWMDEDDQPVVVQQEYWADTCAREHGGTCINRWSHEMRIREAS
jgi:predicted mannosyl-3-phosphoglycerate phosphatase (HAD superfamily)